MKSDSPNLHWKTPLSHMTFPILSNLRNQVQPVIIIILIIKKIYSNTFFFVMQCAVRAAVNGRVLVLDGVEHAERNVLPILNNLLENREMHLENGKFLMAPERYDKLLEVSGEHELYI